MTRWRAGAPALAVALACGTLAAAADAQCVAPDAARWRAGAAPVAWGTRLVSAGAPALRVMALAPGTIEGHIVAGPDAVQGGVLTRAALPREHVVLRLAGPPREQLATLEYLYALVLRADTIGHYRLQRGETCDAAVLSQSDALSALARQRNALAPRAGAEALPWRVVRIVAARPGGPQGRDEVSARVEDEDGPMADAAIVFSRAPHSGCRATTDRRGIAACTLQDSHGDDGDAHENGPVVATFAGRFTATQVAPPISYRLD